uniref:Lipoprotein n=1 Tax=Streptomyces sp. NBC_01401 TaxID=2903854 RepID=A0AAU3GRR5_9ACTN
MTSTRSTRSRASGAAAAAVTAALTLTLLSGCGGTDAAAVPDGWGTLDTRSVSVGYPKDEGYAPQPASARGKSNAAVALKLEKGTRTGMVSVQLDFATGVSDAGEAAAAAGAGIGLGATRGDTRDVRLAGEESAREARRIDYEFTSTGEDSTPAKGTRMKGVVVAGVDSKDVPFAIRINALKDGLSSADLDDFVSSITVK